MTKKIRIYLDTNMILDVFVNHAMAVKKNEAAVLPKKYEFMLANKEKAEFVASFITKAEVARELSSGFGLNVEEIEKIWNDFIWSLGCKFVGSFTFDATIAEIAAKSRMKLRTLFNFMHLFIAMHERCYFVSGDKDMIKKMKSHHVTHNFSCGFLVDFFSNSCPHLLAKAEQFSEEFKNKDAWHLRQNS